MIIILQRVKSANVKVNSKIVGSCERGYCLFVGISNDFEEVKLKWMIRKILTLKCFEENKQEKKILRNIEEVKGDILIISQFTLHARLNNGSKPDFSKSMKFENAKKNLTHL